MLRARSRGSVARNAVERIDDVELRQQVYLDLEPLGRLGQHHARQEVPERVLLPVQEVLLGRDLQRVREDRRSRMRGRPQADHLRRKLNQAIVGISGLVM